MPRLETIFHRGNAGGQMRRAHVPVHFVRPSGTWLISDSRALGFDLYCWLIFIFINKTTNITNGLCLDPPPKKKIFLHNQDTNVATGN